MKPAAIAVACLVSSVPVSGRKLGAKSEKKKKSSKSGTSLVALHDNYVLNVHNDNCDISLDVLGNDYGYNNIADVTVEIVDGPNGGSANVQSNGNIFYDRGSNCEDIIDQNDDVRVDSLRYRICEDGECSNAATVIIAVEDDSYGCIDIIFDRRHLFALMEGDELHRHLSKYEAAKNEKISLCMVPDSTKYGQFGSPDECHHPDNKVSDEDKIFDSFDYEAEPWTFPTMEGTTLLASDPGIWSIDSFLSEDEADKLLALMNKNGNERGLFGPCRHESQNKNAHPLERKLCFMMSSENACEGPYQVSKCEAQVDPEDGAFIEAVLDRFNSMWSVDVEASPYIKLHHYQGDTPPMDLHYDAKDTISFVLYLSDGGASTVFPLAGDGLSTVPKKGSAVTWLNVHSNGSYNNKAFHAVQAHPESAGERNIALIQVKRSALNMA